MSTEYRPDVDGLRALAVLAVIAYHAFPLTLPGGFLGVDVFFVISGFLITGLILSGIRAGTFTITGFYLRRARRILPALLAMFVGITALALFVLMPDELERFANNVTASALFVPNLVFARQTGYFDPATETNPLLHLWSLGVEEQFYLFWPVALILLVPRVKPASAMKIIGAVIAVSLLLHLVIAHYSATTAFYMPFTRFWQLLTGALLAARHFARGEPLTSASVPPSWRADALSIAGLLLMLAPIVGLRAEQEATVGIAIPATVGAALFIAAGPRAWLNRTLFSWKPVVYVGLISYPLYLWHWPPLSMLRLLEADAGPTGRLLRVGAVVFAFAAAMLTYHLVELPVRRYRNLPRLGVRLAGGLVIAAAAGVALAASGGLPQRTALESNPFAWDASQRLDARCSKQYGQSAEWRKNSFCLRNDYSREPSIVILGDSHANMLVPGVLAAYPDASVLQIGASACTYLRNTEFWNDNRRKWRELCPAIVDGAYRGITDSTRVVILAARVPMYAATPAMYSRTFDFESPKHFESPDFPGAGPAEVYERALRRDLPELLGNGREVVLVLPLPELDFEPRSCARIRPIDRWRARPPRSACEMPRSEAEETLAASRELMLRVAREIGDPDLHVVDPMDALCDDAKCRTIRGPEILYRDDNHLSAGGSRYVWSRIRPRGLHGLAPFEANYLSSRQNRRASGLPTSVRRPSSQAAARSPGSRS